MRSVTLGVVTAALALAALSLAACSSFAAAEETRPAADAGAEVEAATSAASCTSPTFVDDPAAKPDDLCEGARSGGAAVSLATDLRHCGACNHGCGITGVCAEGTCTPQVVLPNTPVVSALVVGDTAYVVDANRQVLRGKTSEESAAAYSLPLLPTQSVVRRMQTDGTWLYLSTTKGPQRIMLDGSTSELLTPASGEIDGVMAVGATSYFYASASGVAKYGKDGVIQLTAPSPGTKDVIADGDEAYWVATKGDKTSLHGPFPDTAALVSGPSIAAVALDATYIYYADTAARHIRRVARRTSTGSRSSQPVASELSSRIGALAVDGDFVYWTADRGSADGWVLMRVAKCGGVPVALAKVQPELTQLSFSATHVFVAKLSAPAQLISIPK